MKTKPKLRARRMWANYYRNVRTLHKTRKMAAHCVAPGAIHEVIPVAVIPLNDVPALVATAACAHYEALRLGEGRITNGDCMKAALTAIGVLPSTRKGGAK